MGTSASVQRTKGKRFSQNDATLASLEPGDLVKFQRRGYYHWAVYIGDEEVVHITEQVTKDSPAGKSLVMASLELSKVHITVQSFWEVTKKDKAFKANDRDQDWSPLPRDEIVERAESYLGLGDVRYNVLTSNCEHFAKWCRYDRFHSDQVERLKISPSKVVMSTVLEAGNSAFKKAKQKVMNRFIPPKTLVGDADQESNDTSTTCTRGSKIAPAEGYGESDGEAREMMRGLETPATLSPSSVVCTDTDRINNNLNSF